MRLSKSLEAASEEEANHGSSVLCVRPQSPVILRRPTRLVLLPLIYMYEDQNPKVQNF